MKEADYIECCKSLNACLIEIEWIKHKLDEELEKDTYRLGRDALKRKKDD